jgi:PAS domain S-box-containing protein
VIAGREEPAADVGGEIEWLATTKVPWYDADRKIRGVIGIGRDISKQKQAELALLKQQEDLEAAVAARTEELQQANERLQAEVAERRRAEAALAHEHALLRTLIDALPDAVYVKDRERRFLAANKALAEELGFADVEALIGKTNDEVSAPKDAALFRANDEEVLTTGQPRAGLLEEVEGTSGELHTFLTTKVPVLDAAGQVAGLVGISREITEQRELETALRQREEQYRTLVQSIPGAVYHCALDEHWTMLFMSDGVEKIVGYPASDFIGNRVRSYASIIHPDDQLLAAEDLHRRVTAAPEPFELEYRVLHADGSVRWVREKGQGVFDASGTVAALAGVITDVTEGKWTEDALARERTLLRTVIDTLPDYVFVKDLEGRYVTTNQSYAHLLGETSHEGVAGKTDGDYLPPSLVQKYTMEDREMLETDRPIIGREELSVMAPAGEARWVEVSKAPLHDGAGRLIGLVGVSRDITERRRMQGALRDSEGRYRALFEQAHDAIFLEDREDNIINVNQRACEMYGYSREEMLRLKVRDLRPEEDDGIRGSFVNVALVQSHGAILEAINRRKDGGFFPVEISLTPLKGRQTGLVQVIVRDISERRRTEEELRHRGEALQAANRELADALKAKDEFLATMSHELRSPLNAVLGLTESLQDQVYGELNPRQLQALQTIERSGTHLLALINDVLDVAKIESGELQLVQEMVSVESLCQGSLNMIQETALKKSLRVMYSRQPAVEALTGDGRRLKQILVNLLSNAVKFTLEGGAVGLEVTGDLAQGWVRFVVWDEGVGISQEDLGRLFKPFVQLDSSLSRQYSGTGLGLSLVYRLTQKHGGSVAVESEVGKGSRFSVTLPWRESRLSSALEVLERQAVDSEQHESEGGQPLVLLAEDNDDTILRVTTYLRGHGYAVEVVRSGLELAARGAELLPDIVVMDVHIPEMDGLEAVQRIRQEAPLAALPFVVLTALDTPWDRDACMAAGAGAYLSKPVQPSALLSALKDLLV